jgi:hypothetical protein
MKRALKFLLLLSNFTFAKTALVYYGFNFSYLNAINNDYIIVQPNHINTKTSLFYLYRNKIYAYVSIGELPADVKVPKSWIKSKNKSWGSMVMDINNRQYQNFLMKELEKLRKQGFKNFFFDTLDSFYFYSKTPEQIKKSQKSLADFINKVHRKFPKSKIIVNRGFDIIDNIHNSITAVLFESYYRGLSGDFKSPYKPVSEEARKWLDLQIEKIRKYNKDIICVDYLPLKDLYSKRGEVLFNKLRQKNFIPYISTKDLSIYGKSYKIKQLNLQNFENFDIIPSQIIQSEQN